MRRRLEVYCYLFMTLLVLFLVGFFFSPGVSVAAFVGILCMGDPR